MEEIINKISKMTQEELQEVMQAVEARFAAAYPEWDVVYIARHKEPALRMEEFAYLLDMLAQELPGMKRAVEKIGK